MLMFGTGRELVWWFITLPW